MTHLNRNAVDLNVIYGLWCFCHPGDGIRYVGQTSKGVDGRLSAHKSALKNSISEGKPLSHCQNWMKKHGVDNIYASILEIASSPGDLDELEEIWIASLPGLTNIRPGGSSSRGYKSPNNSRPGASNGMWGRKRPLGFMKYVRSHQGSVTEETRRKMRQAHLGFRHTDASKKKMSEAVIASWTNERKASFGKSRTGDKHPMYGKSHAEESCRKMSMTRTRLTEGDIRAIRKMRSEGAMHKDIVASFPPGILNESTCVKICKGQKFGWVV